MLLQADLFNWTETIVVRAFKFLKSQARQYSLVTTKTSTSYVEEKRHVFTKENLYYIYDKGKYFPLTGSDYSCLTRNSQNKTTQY